MSTASPPECLDERQAYLEADDQLNASLVNRAAADNQNQQAQANLAAAQAALLAAEQSAADAQQNLVTAQAAVGTSAQAADAAYQAWLNCVIGQ